MSIFDTLDDQRMAEMIRNSKEKIIFAAPGIRAQIAEAIVGFPELNGMDGIEIILDESTMVCRLGYGEIQAVDLLMNAAIPVRKCSGLRAGVFLADDQAWFFTPTPLLLEDTPEVNSTAPNAMIISGEQAKAIIAALSPRIAMKERLNTAGEDNSASLTVVPTPEIGYTQLSVEELSASQAELKRIPPEQFNLARQVRVYQSYVQFVELSLKGVALNRHTIQIPTELLNVSGKDEVQDRLRSSYRLINETSSLSGKKINDEIHKLRKEYCGSLGARFGNVILRSVKDEFIQEVEKVRNKLAEFKKEAIQNLAGEFEKSKKDLVELFIPGIKRKPPNELRLRTIAKEPTDDVVIKYITDKLNRCMPDPETFVKDMQLTCDFKDVTYETLNEVEFMNALKKAYPWEEWPDVPYDEFRAAVEKNR